MGTFIALIPLIVQLFQIAEKIIEMISASHASAAAPGVAPPAQLLKLQAVAAQARQSAEAFRDYAAERAAEVQGP